jgi:hypothetical protein
MFIPKSTNIIKPKLYPKVERKDPTIKDKGYVRIDGFELRDKIDICPQLGLQENLIASECNLIFICGAATMGKTYSAFLKAMQGVGKVGYTARLISKRLQDSKKGGSIIRDAKEIFDGVSGCEFTSGDYPLAYYPQWNNAIQLIHSNFNTNNPSEWDEFQDYAKKNQASYIYMDEATEIRDFKMFSYWFSRNRDGSGVKPSMVCSFNPDWKHFTTQMLTDAGYIGEDCFLIKERLGKIMYFVIQGDSVNEIIWGKTREEVVLKAGITVTEEEAKSGITPETIVKSFTCFSGSGATNKILVNSTGGQSISNLYNVGLTERKRLMNAYFGRTDDEQLTVTKRMIDFMFEAPIDSSTEMFASLDVSAGGENADNCPMWIWRGLTAIALENFSGSLKELEGWIAMKLKQYDVPIDNFSFDATGVGNYLKSYTDGRPITANLRPIQEIDSAGNPVVMEQYFNLRSQLMGKTKVLLETGQISCIVDRNKIYPQGKKHINKELVTILYDEINVFKTIERNRKIYYRSKEEYKDNYKSSPDYIDAFIYRMIFELDSKERKTIERELTEQDYNIIW